MVTSHSRGHEIYLDEENAVWRYSDNGEIVDDKRPCKRCGKFPTKEGYDACLGYVEGATSACCGHGVDKPIRIYGGQKMFETQEIRDNTKIVINVPGVDEWTITELRNCCKKNKVKGYTKMDREQLIVAVGEVIANIKSK